MNIKLKIAVGGIIFFLILLITNLIFKLLPVATNKTLLILLFTMSITSTITFLKTKTASEIDAN